VPRRPAITLLLYFGKEVGNKVFLKLFMLMVGVLVEAVRWL